MKIKTICILGGTGFVGRTLANRLSKENYRIIVPTRDRERQRRDLILLPTLDLVETDIHNQVSLYKLLQGCDAVINLVGILNEKAGNGSGFKKAHVELTTKLVKACHENGISRLLHMSALNAESSHGPSHYMRTKGEAENIVHADTELNVTSFQPSVIFGAQDSFFNRFAHLLKMTPWLFPLACAKTKFAPVYVGDVAEAFYKVLNDPETFNQKYVLVGPHVYTLQELVEYTAKCIEIKRKVIPLPDLIGRMQGLFFDFVPGKPFSTDNFLSASQHSISDINHLEDLGIEPVAIESVVPQYLSNRNTRSTYYSYRQSSRRNN